TASGPTGFAAQHRCTRVFIPVLYVAAPKLPRRFAGIIGNQDQSAAPAPLAIVVGHQGKSILFSPGQALEPLGGTDQLLRLAGEGCFQHCDAVPVLGGLACIAAIQRFDPDKGSRLTEPPMIVARACWNALDRDSIGEPKTRDLVDGFARSVPDLNLLWKIDMRMQVGVWPVQPRYKDEIAIRRRAIGQEYSSLADRSDFVPVDLHQRELGRRQIIKN